MYALVEIKGKQYKAEKGALLTVDRLDTPEGQELEFDSVLLTSDGEKVSVGTPYVDGVKVKVSVEGEEKGDKVTIFKFKKRKAYRKRQGHRQKYSSIRVTDIIGA
ncbi:MULTISPECIES: 50S ribosomal protein L21 [Sediminispirochaeta]|jgi:large subunit ribosomal protein L21|uniref:Large ribosomal subunit protein bL21 n=1 Tax=Sediminispirochaeta smaragdinae (strain DSM 11293 / JCM 15392 / SEBR 4228) TaxID=573413 RepID=E1R6B0_SEDSS|nr:MULTISPECIES: 50S ribosomal protein L21 [Sediminispirochaeta]ADK80928.1 ribosomal protein L21 [Sediminispirochaeta smaragdinae DSM 11293]